MNPFFTLACSLSSSSLSSSSLDVFDYFFFMCLVIFLFRKLFATALCQVCSISLLQSVLFLFLVFPGISYSLRLFPSLFLLLVLCFFSLSLSSSSSSRPQLLLVLCIFSLTFSLLLLLLFPFSFLQVFFFGVVFISDVVVFGVPGCC